MCAHLDGVADDTVQYSRGNVFVDSFWKERGDISSLVIYFIGFVINCKNKAK